MELSNTSLFLAPVRSSIGMMYLRCMFGLISTWKQRSALEITKSIKNTDHNLLVIKGIGTYIYDRDIHELVKK